MGEGRERDRWGCRLSSRYGVQDVSEDEAEGGSMYTTWVLVDLTIGGAVHGWEDKVISDFLLHLDTFYTLPYETHT